MQYAIDILYITYQRLDYTRRTLPHLIQNAGVPFHLRIYDNGSTDGTQEYLRQVAQEYPKIVTVVLKPENMGLSTVTNEFWQRPTAEFIGKVDNDTLLPAQWLNRLLEAHFRSPRIGVIGGFHHRLEDVNMPRLQQRGIDLDGIHLIPDAFIRGCCYLMRRSLSNNSSVSSKCTSRKHSNGASTKPK